MESLGIKAFKGASWLALFNATGQIFSWVVTILVARILLPEDYGLVALATLFTGYASRFSELGLGAAIVQKDSSSSAELSSIFWFSSATALLFALSCFPLAFITSYVFDEPRIVPLTLTVSLVFIFTGLQIVPANLMRKNLDFKRIGLIRMISGAISCSFMLACAYMGGGVWTLIGGNVVLSLASLILTFNAIRWFPQWHFKYQEAISYIKFGVLVALSRSMSYLWEKSDRLFVGRFWAPQTVGYYTFALQLAQLPTEKITVLINHVSFPILSKLKNSPEEFNNFYLKVVKITMTMVLPIFVGGHLVSDELIQLLLGEKWLPILFLFKFLCLAQIMTSLNAINGFVNYSLGRPQLSLYFHMASAILMPIAFYFSARQGLNAMIVPWFTVYMLVCSVWILVTLKMLNISILFYLRNIVHPFVAAIFMFFCVSGYQLMAVYLPASFLSQAYMLAGKICVGAVVYVLYILMFDKVLIDDFRTFKKSRG
jgi:O-antigen/teichoic acid export membrane protein